MGIVDIRPVVRDSTKIVIGIAGEQGSGKTVTALLIARGMVSHPSKIGLLDTENKRGSLYADLLDAPFMIGDLYPPFSPTRYSQAIKEFQDAGVEVLVIDSASHEWEGEGGCEDIAEAALEAGKNMADWKKAKNLHKKFINKLLQANMHIITCLRAREKTSFKNPSKPVSLGIKPICEKNFMFEMTAAIMVSNKGHKQEHLKIPVYFEEAFGDGNQRLGIETGKKIIQWVNTGQQEDPEISRLKAEMLIECEKGLEALIEVWKKVPKKHQKTLEAHKNLCKASAEEYDKQRAEAKETPAEQLQREKEEQTAEGKPLYNAKNDLP